MSRLYDVCVLPGFAMLACAMGFGLVLAEYETFGIAMSSAGMAISAAGLWQISWRYRQSIADLEATAEGLRELAIRWRQGRSVERSSS